MSAKQWKVGIAIGGLGFLLITSCGDADSLEKPTAKAERTPVEPEDGPMGSPAKSAEHAKQLAAITQVRFSSHEVTPSPACLAVAATGEVFVGVDQIGSLGKERGKGRIVRLLDTDGDGVADEHTTFAVVNNPRGIFPIGDQVFVLHTTFSEVTEAADGMDLVVFTDKDGDGVADGESTPLISNISSAKFVADRGTDHATNGIRMGIDGWIYIAVGDFGFHDAVDASGRTFTQLGGGVLRVRPDGTETEVYTHGLRNIYDVAIDPYMNIFTRGNTNDGGGWNMRFIHHIQSAEYGYPVLFKHFTEEIAPALADVGGGSGTGSLFLHDPRWPDSLNHVPLMADWGRSELFIHRVTPDGASFTQTEEEFLDVSQITDVDVDGAGRLYMSAWDGAGYSGSEKKGYVVRATPPNWTHEGYAKASSLDLAALESRLRSDSAVARLDASQELLQREGAAELALRVAQDVSAALYVRVAGIFTYAQIEGAEASDALIRLADEGIVREFALRALGDRLAVCQTLSSDPFVKAMSDPSQRVRAAATVGLGRLELNSESAEALLSVPVPASFIAPEKDIEGPHATPNAALLLPHLAVRALVARGASSEASSCVTAADLEAGETPTLALWSLRYMHQESAVGALIAAFERVQGAESRASRSAILETLARLYHKEAPYDGSWWWNTRPDTHGPYYKAIPWQGTHAIEQFLLATWESGNTELKIFMSALDAKHRLGIEALADAPEPVGIEEVAVDLDAIRGTAGEVGASAIEDAIAAVGRLKPDLNRGRALFETQACSACHTLTASETPKGPFMGQIGSIMKAEQIAESILKPGASISQGFATVALTLADGKVLFGFISEESPTSVTLRDITGNVTVVSTDDIKKRAEAETSMMPPGLASALSLQDFASLVGFLAQQKE